MKPDEKPLEIISFRVLGEAVPEGSTRSYYIPKAKKTITKHQNESELNAWRSRIATEAQHALEGKEWSPDASSAYTLHVSFLLTRPQSIPVHKRVHPAVKPDIDKLIRAVSDALTGILYHDDCQIVSVSCSKDYSDDTRTGAYITVSRYSNTQEKAKKKKASEKS